MTSGASRRGHQRERDVAELLRDQDWMVTRAAGSLGCADLVALRDGSKAQLIEVKSTAGGPYERFGPADRERIRAAAKMAGADAVLAWWPPRGQLTWILASAWPT